MHRISRQLVDRILDDPDALNAVGDIGQYIWPRDNDAPDLGLSRSESNFYHYLIYDAEVCRNGHAWFFLNPIGDHVLKILEALQEMNLAAPREILLEACSVFPSSRVPGSQEERIAVMQTLPYEETMTLWDRLDREYFGRWENLQAVKKQVMDYLRAHRGEILQPETA